MRLSEIAEYECKNLSKEKDYSGLRNEIIEGRRDEEYEESLIEPLINYYIHDCLGMCYCGMPELTYEAIRLYLHIKDDWANDNISWEEVESRYKTDLHIDVNDSIQYGLLQFMMYILDNYNFTEHGSSIGGCWVTDRGKRLLTVLDKWHKKIRRSDMYIDFDLITKYPNKYGLTPKNINQLKILDWDRLKEKTWHNQAMKNGNWWCHLEGCNLGGKYNDYNEFWIGFNEDNNNIDYKFYADDGMCSYNFEYFYEGTEIENKRDMNVQVNAIRWLNMMIDEGILGKE